MEFLLTISITPLLDYDIILTSRDLLKVACAFPMFTRLPKLNVAVIVLNKGLSIVDNSPRAKEYVIQCLWVECLFKML